MFVEKQMENKSMISKTFMKAVLQSKDVSRAQCEQLLLFLMDHHLHLFKVTSLHSLPHINEQDRLALLAFIYMTI